MDDTETEADACRRLVTPRLQAAGWDKEPYALQEQRSSHPAAYFLAAAARGEARGRDSIALNRFAVIL